MQAICSIVVMILALTTPGQHETPKGGATPATGLSAHVPSVKGLPRLPQLPRLPPLPRLPRLPRP
jgi:hypothetical protein